MLLFSFPTGRGQRVRPQLHLCQRTRAAQHGESLSWRARCWPQPVHCCIVLENHSRAEKHVFVLHQQAHTPAYYLHIWSLFHDLFLISVDFFISVLNKSKDVTITVTMPSVSTSELTCTLFAVCGRERAGCQTGLPERTQLCSLCDLL